MTDPDTTQVIVVGGGPCGLLTALGLARRGIDVVVLEREVDVFRAPRAMSYHWSALYILDDLDLLEPMKTRGFTLDAANYHVHSTGEDVRFSLAPLEGRVAHPYNLTLGQDRFAELIVERLAEHPNARVLWGTTVEEFSQTDDGVRVRVTTPDGTEKVHRAGWLVASDGAASPVRRALGIEFEGLTWPHQFVATNVRFDFNAFGLPDTNYYIDRDLGAVIAKIQSDGLWRVTWCEDADLKAGQLDERISAFYRALLGPDADYELVSNARYRMHQRAATTMRAGRVLLAGDSAHATNPTSGFGLVGAMHDANVLVDALGTVVDGTAPDTVLDRYSHDRLTAFWTVSSPVSTESKRLVFHSEDPDRLEVDLKMFRRISQDPALTAGFWAQGARIETPSVVTGEHLSRGRNALALPARTG